MLPSQPHVVFGVPRGFSRGRLSLLWCCSNKLNSHMKEWKIPAKRTDISLSKSPLALAFASMIGLKHSIALWLPMYQKFRFVECPIMHFFSFAAFDERTQPQWRGIGLLHASFCSVVVACPGHVALINKSSTCIVVIDNVPSSHLALSSGENSIDFNFFLYKLCWNSKL